MSQDGATESERSQNAVLRSVANRRRRQLVSILRAAETPLTVSTLAAHLAALNSETTPDAVSDEQRRVAHTSLYHADLPILADAGILEREDERVSVVDHPLFDQLVSRKPADISSAGWDATLTALADERRRTVLAVFADASVPLTPAALARRVATRELEDEPTDEETRRVQTALHHVHLPALVEADLLEYEGERVTASVHPIVDAWLTRQRETETDATTPTAQPQS
ncbi:DUF7344 domain-containing protein [Natronobiforma cellulositropha]|uniref:DUF7344 domain-containing protein n=1 Tax=Natronobiforma cellulositropha TaxID=1679076 RepID=UPI0021D5A911|nr:hypothetical protein [Natronobiforma cellulositropha]